MHRRGAIYVIILCGWLFANFALFFFVFYGLPSRTELVSLARIVAVKVGLKDSRAIPLSHSPIICWGDSLTAGIGASFGRSYPRVLQALIGGDILIEGVPGETSTQIKNRFLAASRKYPRPFAIIWAGRNNLEDEEAVESDVAEMVSSLPAGSMYLVVGIINGDVPKDHRGAEDYNHIIAINAHLLSVYRDRYVPIREYLVALYNKEQPVDARDHELDIVPSSLRSDGDHLNDRGYALVATYLFSHWLIRE
jgi:lysophospholipase L1-like esterase